MADLPNQPWTISSADLFKKLDVSEDDGLSDAEVQQRREQYGANRLQEAQRRGPLQILIEQFKSLVIGILAIAAILSFAFAQWIEGFAIVFAILINAAIGFFMEYQAVRSMEALQNLSSSKAKVRRQGQMQEIDAENLVPGDMVLLESGDMIPADLRLTETSKMQVNESSLTGESVPVTKTTEPIEGEVELADRTNMLFKGTALTRGSGEGVVVATGMQTELGHISELAQEAKTEERTPLEKRLNQLGRRLIWVTLIIVALIAISGIIVGKDIRLMVETAVALAVAAIPEGLPIVATIALARGMWRMAKRNALINKLAAVETLGATSVICTDKTGTLTENRMTVSHVVLDSGDIEISGEGLEPEGEFSQDDETLNPLEHDSLRPALEVGVLCNNAALQPEDSNESRVVGDPMEVALLIAGAKADLQRDALLEDMPEVREEAFDPDTKMMATLHKSNGDYRFAVKGAPESVLKVCTQILTSEGEKELRDRDSWKQRSNDLAAQGLQHKRW